MTERLDLKFEEPLGSNMPYKDRRDKRAYDKERYQRRKEEKAKENSEYYLENKEKLLQRGKERRATLTESGHYRTEKYRKWNRDRTRLRHQNLKLERVKALGGKCEKCGEQHPVCLCFHHVNSTAKETVKEWMSNGFFDKIRDGEIVLLCANCHFKEHNPNAYKEYVEALD